MSRSRILKLGRVLQNIKNFFVDHKGLNFSAFFQARALACCFLPILLFGSAQAFAVAEIAPLETRWRVPENSDLNYKTFNFNDEFLGKEICQFYGGADWNFQKFTVSRYEKRNTYYNGIYVPIVKAKAVRCVDSNGSIQDIMSIWQGYYCPAGNTLEYTSEYATWLTITIDGCSLNKPDKDNSCPTGLPVYLGMGNKSLFETDITDGDQLRLRRVYNSRRAESSGAFGTNWRGTWTHSYDRRLLDQRKSSINTVFLSRPNGDLFYYNIDTSLLATPVGQVRGTLVSQGNGAWRFTTNDNQIEDYDSSGRLVSITDLRGNIQTLSYDANDRLERVETTTAEFLNFTYDGNNRIINITDYSGRTWGYRYDSQNNLEYIDNPDTTTRRYHYEDASLNYLLTGITDERGIRYSTYAYDGSGKPILSTLANNVGKIEITYNSADGSRLVSNSLGQTTTYNTAKSAGAWMVTDIIGPGCSVCGASNVSSVYEPGTNNLLSKTENGITTQYGNYDAKGQYGYRIEAVGTTEERRTDYTYDPRYFNKISTITEPSVYFGRNKVTVVTYDDFGNRTSQTINGFKPDGTPVTRTTTYQYNGPINQLSQINGPRTEVVDITTLAYYANDVLEGDNQARLETITGPEGIVLRSNIGYSATGKVLSEDRPNGLSISYTYYVGNDRLETLTEISGGVSRITRWTYLATGEVETITQGYGTADVTIIMLSYDDARRLTRITDGLGNYLEYTLDTEGNKTGEDTFDTNDVLQKTLSRTFDSYSKVDQITQLNQIVDYNYKPDGTLADVTDGNLVPTTYQYDALQRLTHTTRNDGGGDTGTADTLTQYQYDIADRLTSVIDPNNNATSYAYDDLGNLLTQASPDTGTSTYQYDPAGNMTQMVDSKNQLFAYSYDALNRLYSLNAPGTADDITYDYDTCTNGAGRLCAVTYGINGDGNDVSYAYDSFGSVITHQGISYTYDAVGRLSTMTYPSGNVATYNYDVAGQVNSVSLTTANGTQLLASNITYAPFGGVSSLTYGNGLALSQQWDTAYRLTSQNTSAYSASYSGYDGNGNLTNRQMGTSNELYSYDALNQLDTATGAFGARNYNYDFNGNRTVVDRDGIQANYSYQTGSNILATETGWSYSHDANGNRAAKTDPAGIAPATNYAHTPYNRLASVSSGEIAVGQYTYNGLGQRSAKTTISDSTTFIYDLAGQMVMETDANGESREYIYLNGQPLTMQHVRFVPPAAQEVILDEDSAGVTLRGTWALKKGRRSYSNDFILAAGTTALTLNNSATFTPTLDGGVYEVYGWWPRIRKNSPIVPVTVVHANGTSQLTVDQTTTGRSWVLLGKYTFNAGSAGTVTFSDANGAASADAVRFVKVVTETPPTAVVNLYTIHNDHLGTPQMLTNNTGSAVWQATYGPFGQTGINEDVDGDGAAVSFNLAFPGQYYDGESGLHYNYFRYYDPSAGRYVTSDPIGLLGGLNTYGYVDANPLTLADPYGLDANTLGVDFNIPILGGVEFGIVVFDGTVGGMTNDGGAFDIGVFGTLKNNIGGAGLFKTAISLSQTIGCRDNFEGTDGEFSAGAGPIGISISGTGDGKIGNESLGINLGLSLGAEGQETVTGAVTVGDIARAIASLVTNSNEPIRGDCSCSSK